MKTDPKIREGIVNLEQAQKIVQDTIEGRKRWGKMFAGEASSTQLLDALCVLSEALEDTLGGISREEHTRVIRQLTASKAREAKLKKQIEKLEGIISINKLA